MPQVYTISERKKKKNITQVTVNIFIYHIHLCSSCLDGIYKKINMEIWSIAIIILCAIILSSVPALHSIVTAWLAMVIYRGGLVIFPVENDHKKTASNSSDAD